MGVVHSPAVSVMVQFATRGEMWQIGRNAYSGVMPYRLFPWQRVAED